MDDFGWIITAGFLGIGGLIFFGLLARARETVVAGVEADRLTREREDRARREQAAAAEIVEVRGIE